MMIMIMIPIDSQRKNIQVLAICVSDFDIILLVCKKRGDGFYVGFQKKWTCIFYGSSVSLRIMAHWQGGHKVYIPPPRAI